MFAISFYSTSDIFAQTRILFDDLMNNFYIIGYDNIAVDGNEKKDCETEQTGTLQVINNSDNPYDIYVNGQYILRLPGKKVSEPILIIEGNNNELYAKQVSGYMMYPTEKKAYLNVISCSEYNWQIP